MRKVVGASLLADRVGESFAAVVTAASPKGTYARLLSPPVEGRIVRGSRGLDVGDTVRLTLVVADPVKGFIDFSHQADDASRKLERSRRKKAAADLLRPRIGEVFQAEVTGVSESGTYVRLADGSAEGRVVRGYKTLLVGMQVPVKLVGTDSVHGFIDFEFDGGIGTAKEERLTRKRAMAVTLQDRIGTSFDAVVSGTSQKATWITVEPDEADTLVPYLEKMRFMLRVEVADVSSDFAVVGEPIAVRHSDFPTYVIASQFGELEADDAASKKYVPLRPDVWVGREVIVPRSEVSAYVDGRAGSGTWAWEALRIAAGVPRLGFETDHRTIPQEVGWVPSAVHLDKGCYRGQETVARVHNLGRPPRRLVQLHLDGSASRTPVPGDPVLLDGREVGRLTSVALHAERGPVALAVIKRSVAPDAVLTVGPAEAEPVAASQEIVVTG